MIIYCPCNFVLFKPHKMGIFQPLNDYSYMPLNKDEEKGTSTLNNFSVNLKKTFFWLKTVDIFIV